MIIIGPAFRMTMVPVCYIFIEIAPNHNFWLHVISLLAVPEYWWWTRAAPCRCPRWTRPPAVPAQCPAACWSRHAGTWCSSSASGDASTPPAARLSPWRRQEWTDPQLSIMIIYNSTWSILLLIYHPADDKNGQIRNCQSWSFITVHGQFCCSSITLETTRMDRSTTVNHDHF